MISGRHSSDHLPVDLVKKARQVFDRLSSTGTPIHYHQLALRWPTFQCEHFPPTFLDCLRRITPPNGMLTFERFCAGLRLALAEERENYQKQSVSDHSQQIRPGRSVCDLQMATQNPPPNPPTRGQESVEKTKQLMNLYGSSQSVIATRPTLPPYKVALSRLNPESIDQGGNQLKKVLARSTPHLCQSANGLNGNNRSNNGLILISNGQKSYTGQESLNGQKSLTSQGSMNGQRSINGQEPLNGQRSMNCQKSMTSLNGIIPDHSKAVPPTAIMIKNGQRSSSSRPSSAQSTDTNGSLEGIRFRDKSGNGNGVALRGQSRPIPQDSRRHTMMDGSEAVPSHSKHILLAEEEKGLLHKAIDTSRRLQNWYNERLSSLETREKLLGKSMIPVDVAVHEERLNYLRAHITEVNRRAVALMESSDKGFPWHMNLELHRNIPQPADDQLMWLKRQNKMLTDEVAEKCDRITQLESEKAQLLKHLCESPGYKNAIHQSTSVPPPINGGPSNGADSGFHSLSHQSPPSTAVPFHQHQPLNGHHQNAVYATPFAGNKNPRYDHNPMAKNQPSYDPNPPAVPPPHKRVYAELHKPPAEIPINGVLATFM